MTKAKIASTTKNKVVFSIKGKEIRPVKFISETASFMAAEYKDSSELIVDDSGKVMSWASAKNICDS